jgi:hypothetical protein
MVNPVWVYRLSDGVFLWGGYYDPTIPGSGFDPTVMGVDTLPAVDGLSEHPDPARERYAAASPTRRRWATTAETTVAETARLDAEVEAQVAIRALARVTWEALPTPKPSWVDFWQRIRERYRQGL